MADFARYLPLSQRRPGDESDVDGDRRAALADVVDLATGVVAAGDAAAAAASARSFAEAARLGAEYDRDTDAPGAALRDLAARVRRGRRRSIRALAAAVRALLALSRDTAVPVDLDPMVAGAVALYASTTAPLARRAVVKGHTVRAADADWAFGNGPVLTAPAAAIAAFLLGVSEDPPRRASPPADRGTAHGPAHGDGPHVARMSAS